MVSRRRRRPTKFENPCSRFDFRSLPRTQRFGDLYRPDTREQKTRNANRVQTRDQCGCPRPFSLLHSRICRCPSDSYDFVRQDLCETFGGGILLRVWLLINSAKVETCVFSRSLPICKGPSLVAPRVNWAPVSPSSRRSSSASDI